jgi:tRNA(Ser,Leu) C12 N-acetylase TAN1
MTTSAKATASLCEQPETSDFKAFDDVNVVSHMPGLYLSLYEYDLLASSEWGSLPKARDELRLQLRSMGDSSPVIERTIARGILGIRTSLDPRKVVAEFNERVAENPNAINYVLKLRPVDLWTAPNLTDLKVAVSSLKGQIRHGERWSMEVELRRFTTLHRLEIIEPLAELIDEKVDLTNPEKTIRIEILGNSAAVSVLKPEDVFSLHKPRLHGRT